MSEHATNNKLPFARDFRDLAVYRRQRQLSRTVFEASKTFPREEMYSLTDQLRRASRSIGAQIVEAWAKRDYPRHFASKLTDADAEQFETQHWIGTAFDCAYLTRDQAAELINLCQEVGRMLGAMKEQSKDFCTVREDAADSAPDTDLLTYFPHMPCHNYDLPTSRRDFLRRAGCGFGAVALAALMREPVLAAPTVANPAAAALPQRAGRAKNVIFLFMEGGPSHLDMFDPQAAAQRARRAKAARQLQGARHSRWAKAARRCSNRKRTWKQHGQSGLWISDWFRKRRAACRRSRGDPLVRLRRHQPRRRRLPDEHRLDLRRPAVARRVGQLRPRHGEPEPARLRRHQGQRRHRGERRAQLGQRLHARGVSGRRVQLRWRADQEPRYTRRA